MYAAGWITRTGPHFLDGHRLSSLYRAAVIVPNQRQVNPEKQLARPSIRTYFAAQVAALKDYRSHGEQKMLVQHVNVSDGGQSVTGNVSTTARGQWQTKKQEFNPMHWPIHLAPRCCAKSKRSYSADRRP
jgi:hypothetical protein